MHFFSGNREEGDDEDIIVEADKGRIIQVISNILSNAIRFAKEGDVIISLKRSGEIIEPNDGKCNHNDDDNNNSKGEVIVSIKDTGIGYIQTYSQDYSQSLLSHPKQWALD